MPPTELKNDAAFKGVVCYAISSANIFPVFLAFSTINTVIATTPKFKMAAIWVNFGVLRLNTNSRGVIL